MAFARRERQREQALGQGIGGGDALGGGDRAAAFAQVPAQGVAVWSGHWRKERSEEGPLFASGERVGAG
ncbi:hypothetical protein GCM10009090_04090 [[Pseudomonas] boreopolis]|uniref:Uncharacterized protein n=1 Tax=Xanthomonas boreopolis TaxID=86183 RepID=A0A919KGQ0_9XANT|nr:hypothetical protein GCM10009090_04090 [[Pseudomonas] boreopolis]